MVKKDFYELTNPQKNIYLREEYYPNTSINNISFTYYFEKDLNPEICVKAINKIIESNDALRIRIKKDGNNVFQYISQYCYEEIPIFNCVNKTLIEKKQEMEIDAKKIFKLGMGAAALLYRGFAKRHSRISICRILHVYGRWERKGGNAYERLVFAVVFEGAVGAFCGFRLNQEKMDLFLHGSICGVLCGACACWILPALDCRERIDVLDSRFCLRHFRHRRGRILYACARRQISIFLCRHTQRLLQDCRALWAGRNARNRGLFWKVFRFAFGRLGSGVPHVRCSVFHCSGLFLKSSPAPSNRRAARGFFGGGNRAQYALGVRGVLF